MSREGQGGPERRPLRHGRSFCVSAGIGATACPATTCPRLDHALLEHAGDAAIHREVRLTVLWRSGVCTTTPRRELTKTELRRFYEIIDDSKRRHDDATAGWTLALTSDGDQKASDGADLWFVTMDGTAKISDLRHDPHVHLSCFQNGYDWVSASGGIAEVQPNREKITNSMRLTGSLVSNQGDPTRWYTGRSANRVDRRESHPRGRVLLRAHAASRPVVLYMK